jgi:hypothetical protein
MRLLDNEDAFNALREIDTQDMSRDERQRRFNDFVECMNIGGIWPKEIREKAQQIKDKYGL